LVQKMGTREDRAAERRLIMICGEEAADGLERRESGDGGAVGWSDGEWEVGFAHVD
jgi:hypothetical protein